jgi:hypothetical protein
MAIEIKELIIKTNIVSRPATPEGDSTPDQQAIKEEILAQCKQMVQTMLRERRER